MNTLSDYLATLPEEERRKIANRDPEALNRAKMALSPKSEPESTAPGQIPKDAVTVMRSFPLSARKAIAEGQTDVFHSEYAKHQSFLKRSEDPEAYQKAIDAGDKEYLDWTLRNQPEKSGWEIAGGAVSALGHMVGSFGRGLWDVAKTVAVGQSSPLKSGESMRHLADVGINTAAQITSDYNTIYKGAPLVAKKVLDAARGGATPELKEARRAAKVDFLIDVGQFQSFAQKAHKEFANAYANSGGLKGLLADTVLGTTEVDPRVSEGLSIAFDPGNISGASVAKRAASVSAKLGAQGLAEGILKSAGVKSVNPQLVTEFASKQAHGLALREQRAAAREIVDTINVASIDASPSVAADLEKAWAEATKKVSGLNRAIELNDAAMNTLASQMQKEVGTVGTSALRTGASGLARGVGTLVEKAGAAGERVVGIPRKVAEKVAPGVPEVQRHLETHTGQGAIGAAVSAAPAMLRRLGRDVRVMGEMFSQGEQILPFWRRVRQSENVTKASKWFAGLADNSVFYTAGKIGSPAIKGAASAAPVGAAFGYLGSGGDTEGAVTGAVTVGAIGAGVGATVGAFGVWKPVSADQMKLEFANTHRAFRERLAARAMGSSEKGADATTKTDLDMFDKFDLETQHRIAWFASVFPDLDLKFFSGAKGGSGFYRDGTAWLNVNNPSDLAPTLAHEVAHHIEQHGMTDRVVQMMLGDRELDVMGMLSKRDGEGKVVPSDEFIEHKRRYTELLKQTNPEVVVDDRTAAREIFAEIVADRLLRDGGATVRSDVRSSTFNDKMLEALSDLPVLRDSAFVKNALARRGFSFGENWDILHGTGVFKGLRNSKDVQKLVRKYLRDVSKGRGGKLTEETGRRGTVIEPRHYVNDPKILDRILDGSSDVLRDPVTGEIVIKDGAPVFLSPSQVKKANAEFADAIFEFLDANADKSAPSGNPDVQPVRRVTRETARGPVTTYEGQYLPDALFDHLANSGRFNPHQIGQMKLINEMLRKGGGEGILTFYQAALANGRGRYRSLSGRWLAEIPHGFVISKQGNVLIRTISVEQLYGNVDKAIARGETKKIFEREWLGSRDALMKDIQTYLKNATGERRPTKELLGENKRDFIENLFGIRMASNSDVNPLFDTTKQPNSVLSDLRLDRMNKVSSTGADINWNGRAYGFVKGNFRPEVSAGVADAPVAGSGNDGRAATGTTEGSVPKGGRVVAGIAGNPESAGRFHAAISEAARTHPAGAAVEVKDVSAYADPSTKLFLSADESAGAAVTADGDLVSVFKKPGSKVKIDEVLKPAAEQAVKLDAFASGDGYLQKLYSKYGFESVARVAFNREFAPKGWNFEKFGEPDVVFMAKGAPKLDEVPLVGYEEAAAMQKAAVDGVRDATDVPLYRPATEVADFVEPTKTVTAYKMFRTLKSRPGELFPLFIGKTDPVPVGEWLVAENLTTKGFAPRPGWHAGAIPDARHLMSRDGKMQEGRVWAEVEMPAEKDYTAEAQAQPTKDFRDKIPERGFYKFSTQKEQGEHGWIIGGALKVKKILSPKEVDAINAKAGVETKTEYSNPNVQYRPQTETPEFKRWFGDSQVVDAEGKPMVMHHATDADFSRFEVTNDIGFHFGDAQAANERLAQTEGASGSRVMPVYLKINKPLRLPDLQNWEPGNVTMALRDAGVISDRRALDILDSGEIVDQHLVKTLLAREGYDGIVYKNEVEGSGDSYIVFDSNQIKSVYNRGTFDPADPNILHRPAVPFEAVQDQVIPGTKKKKDETIGQRYGSMITDDALVPMFAVDGKGNIVLKKGKPVVTELQYDFMDSPAVKHITAGREDTLDSLRTRLNTSSLTDARAGIRSRLTPEETMLLDEMVEVFARKASEDLKRFQGDEEVLAASGWYADVSKFLAGIFPDGADKKMFLELLGGTSPNTNVEQNFLYALDLYNKWKKGSFDENLKRFRDLETNFDSLLSEWLSGDKKSGYQWASPEKRKAFEDRYAALLVQHEGAQPGVARNRARSSTAKTPTEGLIWDMLLMDLDVIPRRVGGKKYGIHTERILQIFDGTWLERTGAPKAPNFTANLEGTSTRATIDVWAARWLRRIGYEGGGGRWRILPMSEKGVSNYDFFFGQEVFERATQIVNTELKDLLGLTREINPDDLQALMWFAEKRTWLEKGWADSESLGDFRNYFGTEQTGPKMLQKTDGTYRLSGVNFEGTSDAFLSTLELEVTNSTRGEGKQKIKDRVFQEAGSDS